MTSRSVCVAVLAICCVPAACGDNLAVDEEGGGRPVLPEAEEPIVDTVVAPDSIDGEYAMRIELTSYVCRGEVVEINPPAYAIADVVEQNGPTRFNMLAKGAGGFYDFSHWNVERQSDGFFTDEFFVEWYITPGFPPAVFIINATGSVFSESLNFVNHWLVGWNDTGGIWHTECELSINNDGPRRYHNWDRVSRSGIDGQWRVWHEVVEDSIAAILPEPYYQSIDTIAQNQDGSLFDLKGTRAGLLANLPRASNGRVEETIPASGTVYRITGWITNDHLDLTVTWDWYNQTGELIWHVKDRYRGTPRFQPHVKKSPSLPLGAFNAEIVQTANTFDGLLEAPHRYVIDVLPADNGQIVLWIGGIKTQPSNLIANADGSFSFRFVRSSGGYYYDYSLNDLVITGDKISFLMQVNAIPSGSTEVLYIFDYTASGDKRFRHFFSTAP